MILLPRRQLVLPPRFRTCAPFCALDVLGDDRTYNPGSGAVSGGGGSPGGEAWDQSAGSVFDGETDGGFLLLPGTVNFGALTNVSDVTFEAARFQLDDLYGNSSGSTASLGRGGGVSIAPHGTLISDGWDVAFAPSSVGSFDGLSFYYRCFDTATGLTQFGPSAFYTISPQAFGAYIYDANSIITPDGSTLATDYYCYNYSASGAISFGAFTVYVQPYGFTSTGTFPINWAYGTDADAGVSFTPLSDGRLQIDVDLSLMTSGTGAMQISVQDNGSGGSTDVYPRSGSTHNAIGGGSIQVNVGL